MLISVALGANMMMILAAFLVVAPRRSIPREGIPALQDVRALLNSGSSGPNGARKYALLRTAFAFGVPGLLLSAAWLMVV
jgi:hypothetical protein